VTFTLTNGQAYVAEVQDYKSCLFNHWSDTESTTRDRTISISSDTQITAVFNCGGSSGGGGGSTSSVIVNSVNQNGNSISGYYAALYGSGGQVLASGFTSATFSTTSGLSYSVQADNYGSCTFSKWTDGITSDPRTFTATSSPQTFTAVYNCGGSSGSGTSTIDISTVNSGGSPISGYYITLWQNGVQLNSCYSACSFTVNNGQTYQIAAASYGSETFNHWQSDGSTGFETVTVPGTSTTISLTAVYHP
jgi:hypothetical protein